MKKYRIHQIKLKIDEPVSDIPEIIKAKCGKNTDIISWNAVRRSVDARDKGDIRIVYSVDFETPSDSLDLAEAPDLTYRYPVEPGTGERLLQKRPVIAGFGPCGMFCALILSQMGMAPIVIERGRPVDERTADIAKFWQSGELDPESNVQFGEGGAGTFSDGKLTTGIKDPRVRKVIEEFAAAGAPVDILIDAKPHIGTDILKNVVRTIRMKIIENGGEVRFSERLENIESAGNVLKGITLSGGETIETDDLVLALGHSARDTFSMLSGKGLEMMQKPFSIGVRIEHEQELINRAQYGDPKLAAKLGPADYKLNYHARSGRGVYTFCMCPGGNVIIASSEEGGVVTNGMSGSLRDGKYANSGLLVDVRPDDFASSDPLAGVEFQRKYERLAFRLGGGDYTPPEIIWKEFHGSPVEQSLPGFAADSLTEAMPFLGRKLRGFDSPYSRLIGVETRSSSPVRLLRDENMMTKIKGVYACGEGAGYAGGIVSAAADGIKAAEKIALRYSEI
ncbi:MAG: NAD(FAD)-utilizing dehydrogenase [Eubacteriaceae bacterium]|nr:NAD(FAD)-utilizing dehydrogenase [Eubacteriaceae bacterium]